LGGLLQVKSMGEGVQFREMILDCVDYEIEK
jgi:hypothetical protein